MHLWMHAHVTLCILQHNLPLHRCSYPERHLQHLHWYQVEQNKSSNNVKLTHLLCQVLREDEDCCLVQPKVWVEMDKESPHEAQQIRPALLRLPIWTDAVSSPVQKPSQSADPARSPHTKLSLPQSISWQRTPEPMLVKAIRLRFKHQSASEILQGMVCGLSINVMPAGRDKADGPKQAASVELQLRPEDFVIVDEQVLRAEADLPVHVDEYVSISTTGTVYGPGDCVYLASWSRKATSQNFTDDALGTSYILSHGDAAEGLCLVEVLLQQAEDPGAAPTCYFGLSAPAST